MLFRPTGRSTVSTTATTTGRLSRSSSSCSSPSRQFLCFPTRQCARPFYCMLNAPANYFIFGGIFVFSLMLVPSELIASANSIPRQFDVDAAVLKHPDLVQMRSHASVSQRACTERVLSSIFLRSGGASRLFQFMYNVLDLMRKSKAKKLATLHGADSRRSTTLNSTRCSAPSMSACCLSSLAI